MNPQFKKGVLELIVLEAVRRKDRYGYELVEEVSRVIDVNEGTIYPLLKREIPAHFHAHRADDILTAIRIAHE
ncbi:MAG: hypothetical protein EGQ17_06260, partial [Lachnospiraceae bacterium]|nr:hypothetical protein [Lachnospiraceae bacterium]